MKRIKLIAQIVLCTAALPAYIIAELNRGAHSADAPAATMATAGEKVDTKNISANETAVYKPVLIQTGNTFSAVKKNNNRSKDSQIKAAEITFLKIAGLKKLNAAKGSALKYKTCKLCVKKNVHFLIEIEIKNCVKMRELQTDISMPEHDFIFFNPGINL
jgi:hypothetical protein